MRTLVCSVLFAAAVAARGDALQTFLAAEGKAPAEYIASKTAEHRVVIAGENHWQRADAELIAALVPALRQHGVALAMEFFHAPQQNDLDALLSANEWNEPLANSIMRGADWPYVQYRDILRAAWSANRTPSDAAPMRVIAIGPPDDWRKQGLDYDAFMAGRVFDYTKDEQHRLLIYCGMHHAFTRYVQVDRRRNGRAIEFMDRLGNILWRRLGEEVFVVALHKPDPCGGTGDKPSTEFCAPFDGLLDCAATRAGGRPVAFDILGSPVAEAKFPAASYYAWRHPLLRLIDYADGYVWQGPVDSAPMVDFIPPENGAEPAHRELHPNRKGLDAWRAACAAAPQP